MAARHTGYITTDFDMLVSKKEDMLAVSDTAYFFWFSDDCKLQEADPNAYWLMNRLMQSVQYVRTAEDGFAWALALNDNIKEYSRRIDRRIYEIRSEDAAVRAIDDLISTYGVGNQPELNAYSYVKSILEIYRTTNEYIRTLRFLSDAPLKELIYKEYKAWFNLNNAANGIMVFHTYAAAGYSALPMEINTIFEYWSKERYREMEIEKDTFGPYNGESFKADRRRVSQKKFLKLIRYFKSLTLDTVVKTNGKDWNLKKSEYPYGRLDGCYDFDKISEMEQMYENAYLDWLAVREEIAAHLPKQQSKIYQEVTRQMNSRLYSDLMELKVVKY